MDGVHGSDERQHVRLHRALGVAGEARRTRAEQHGLSGVLRQLCRILRRHGKRLLQIDRQHLGLGLPVEKPAELAVGLRHFFERRFEENRGNAGLLLDAVHIAADVLLGIAKVDDELRLGVDQCLHVEVGLAAVELAERRQRPHLRREIRPLRRAGRAGKADEQLRHERHQDHLCRRAAGCDARNAGRDRHIAPGIVGEHRRLHTCQRVILLPAAAGEQAQQQGEAERQRQDLFHWDLPVILFRELPKGQKSGSLAGKSSVNTPYHRLPFDHAEDRAFPEIASLGIMIQCAPGNCKRYFAGSTKANAGRFRGTRLPAAHCMGGGRSSTASCR